VLRQPSAPLVPPQRVFLSLISPPAHVPVAAQHLSFLIIVGRMCASAPACPSPPSVRARAGAARNRSSAYNTTSDALTTPRDTGRDADGEGLWAASPLQRGFAVRTGNNLEHWKVRVTRTRTVLLASFAEPLAAVRWHRTQRTGDRKALVLGRQAGRSSHARLVASAARMPRAVCCFELRNTAFFRSHQGLCTCAKRRLVCTTPNVGAGLIARR